MTGLDRLFKDLKQDDRPFGGKLVVMSGNFRQNLPRWIRGTNHKCMFEEKPTMEQSNKVEID
jgi:hypothetical protein